MSTATTDPRTAPTGPATPPASSRTADLARWLRMAGFETRILMRRKTTVLSVLTGPALMIFFPLVQTPPNAAAWAALAGLAGVIGLMMATYTTATSVLTMRRESGVLNRQRTTELTGPQIVTASAAPLLAAGVLQLLVIYVVYVTVMGAPAPVNVGLVALGAILGGLFCVAAAAATSTVSKSAEGVQYTVLPLLLSASVAGNLVVSPILPGGTRALLLLMPGAPITDLVFRGWAGAASGVAPMPVPAVPTDLALLVGWTLVAVLLTRLRWRWTARR